MEKQGLQSVQTILEKNPDLLKPTELGQTSSVDGAPSNCGDCGGAMVLGMNDHFYCVPCTDKLIAADEAAIRAENERYKQEAPSRELAQKIGASAIGERFKGMTFADYKPTCEKAVKVFSECQSYVENFKNDSGCNVLMIGSPGTGKNMLAAIIGQEIIKRNSSFFHTTAMKLVRRIKSTWKNNDEDEQKVIDSFVSPSLLVIDEIGVQFGSATEQLFLTEVINERYEKRRPTILISNLKLSQLTEVMGERVVDRFYDDGSKLLVFDWQSYRRNKP